MSHHTKTPSFDQVPSSASLLDRLPPDLDHQARSLGAFTRSRRLCSPSLLLHGLLLYVFSFLSFRSLSLSASSLGLAHLSHRAWRNRLPKALPWLRWLLSRLLSLPSPSSSSPRPTFLVDATHFKALGRHGETFRLHCGYHLSSSSLHSLRITSKHVAERFDPSLYPTGSLLIADSGYAHAQALLEVAAQHRFFLVRLPSRMCLWDEQGERVDLLDLLGSTCLPLTVFLKQDDRRFPLRLVSQPLSAKAAERARKRVKRARQKHQTKTPDERAMQCAGHLFLLTNLSEEEASSEDLLSLYRQRWQIELLFKRIKQHLNRHRLTGKTWETNEAVLLLLLIGWVLMEQEMGREEKEMFCLWRESRWLLFCFHLALFSPLPRTGQGALSRPLPFSSS